MKPVKRIDWDTVIACILIALFVIAITAYYTWWTNATCAELRDAWFQTYAPTRCISPEL